MRLYFEEGTDISPKLESLMEDAAKLSLEREGIPHENAEVSVTFVDGDEIRELNARFRNKDSVTDVLSFPQFDDIHEIVNDAEGDVLSGDLLLGDVVICREVAEKQAEEYGHSYERELMYLFVHSMMHLLGYDHMEEDEKRLMRKAEEEVLSKIGITREYEPDAEGDNEVEPNYALLMDKAKEISENAYAPYSIFKVGAAILAESGRIYQGVNIENSSYGATICAERSALSAAVSAGERKFKAIAVYSPQGSAWPCGICRQVLFEFSPDMDVIAEGKEGYEICPLSQLLVKGFRL